MTNAAQKQEATVLVKLSDAFTAAVYSNLRAPVLKPFFAVLGDHDARMLSDYRRCVAEFKAAYGRKPHAGYYSMAKETFNRSPLRALNMVALIGPQKRLDDLVVALKNVDPALAVVSTLAPQISKAPPERRHIVDSALEALKKPLGDAPKPE